MSVNYGEPPSKRSRGEMGFGERTITLNMAKYDRSVQYYSDDDLVKLFELGLKIKESAVLSINVNPKIVEEAINVEMQPVHVSLARMEGQMNYEIQQVKKEVSGELERGFEASGKNVGHLGGVVSKDITDLSSKLTTSVETVARKVQPLDLLNSSIGISVEGIKTQLQMDMQGSESRLEQRLNECNLKLDYISWSLEKPSGKGSRGEREVIEILNSYLQHMSYTIRDTSRTAGHGDIRVDTPNGHKIMIEVKSRERAVPKNEIEKFEENLANAPNYKVGILLSMTSGIARRGQQGWFEVAFVKNQYRIYVPNAYANREEHLIVWSVVLAAQLSSVDGELGEGQRSELMKIYNKFKEIIEQNKKCKSDLKALKECVKNLESSLNPIVDFVDQTAGAINKLLHSRASAKYMVS